MNVNERLIVAQGDQGIVPLDTDIFTSPVDLYDNVTDTINIPEGRIAIWDPVSGKALDSTNIAGSKDIIISTRVGDEIRSISGDQLRGVALRYINVDKSNPGASAIKAFLFRCTSCGEGNSLVLEIEDNDSVNEYPYPKKQRVTVTVNTDCDGCDDCAGPESNGEEIACKFRDYINGKPVPNASSVINSGHHVDPSKLAVTALKAYNETDSFKTFCLGSAGSCTGKVAGPKDVTFTLPNGGGAVALDYSSYLDGSGDISLTDLKTVAKLIDKELGGYGDVAVTKGAGQNGQAQLLVSTCITDFVITDFADAAIVPCSELNPLTPISVVDYCPSCDGANTTETFDHGIIVVGDEVELPCEDCALPTTIVSKLTRDINIYPTGSWHNNATHTLTIQELVRPKNLGYSWRNREWAQDPGGSDRGGFYEDTVVGRYNQRLAGSRSDKMETKCCEDYCAYSIGHGSPHTGALALYSNMFGPEDVSIVLIEEGATTTQGEFEAAINAWSAAWGMGITSVACATPNTIPNGELS